MTDPTIPGPRPGRVLGHRYELVQRIATGGMAEVWEGHDPVLERPVAVKILHPHLSGDHGFLTRFHREALAAARLSHTSIVSIFDTVTDGDLEAIVMELLVGRTLRDALDEFGRLDDPTTLEIGRQVADALREAHRCGVVHRDIKPSNIVLCADRRVVVTDFGIAKASEDTDLTVTGTLLGTAKYLSPEQVEGTTVDPRSDLYSLGVVLYECATGEVPFRADNDAATALARLHQAAPLARRVRPDCPLDLEAVIDRCLARQPSGRPSTAAELHAQLSGVDLDVLGGNHDATVAIAADHLDDHVWVDPHAVDEPYEPDDGAIPVGRVRNWFATMFVVILVGVAIAVASLLFVTRPDDDPLVGGTTTLPSELGDDTEIVSPVVELVPPTIAAAVPFDPGGDGVEQNERAPLAHDGDPTTAWPTETYRRPQLGALKAGVGLRLLLDGTASVSTVRIDTDTTGFALSVHVGSDLGDLADAWPEAAGAVSNGDGSVTIQLEGAPIGDEVVLWITEQGSSRTDGRLRLEIYEIELG